MREARTGAVIAAAGMSSRMGDFKPLLEIGTLSFAKRAIANFRQADVSPIVLVTGYNAAVLEKHVAGEDVLCVRNDAYESTEMIDSVAIGLSYIKDKCDRTFLTPVDVPLFRADTVAALMRQDAAVVRPVHEGKRGHPVLVSNSISDELSGPHTAGGLREVLRFMSSDTAFVTVDDKGILLDADTPDDYRELAAYHSAQLFRAEIDIRLLKEQCILDRRTAALLRVIAYDGTVKDACYRLGISYRNAWNMIKSAETALGCPLIERQAGGACGGGSSLTQKGEEFLRCYERYESRVRQFAADSFAECFASFGARSPKKITGKER